MPVADNLAPQLEETLSESENDPSISEEENQLENVEGQPAKADLIDEKMFDVINSI